MAVDVFRGRNDINLDSKGRLALPTRYRDAVQESCAGHMILTLDISKKFLLLYPLPDWEEIEAKVSALSGMNKANRNLQLILIGHATDVEMDANGRVVVPPTLRKLVGLDKSIVMFGQGKRFEIWGQESWEEKWAEINASDILDADEIPDDLMSLSL